MSDLLTVPCIDRRYCSIVVHCGVSAGKSLDMAYPGERHQIPGLLIDRCTALLYYNVAVHCGVSDVFKVSMKPVKMPGRETLHWDTMMSNTPRICVGLYFSMMHTKRDGRWEEIGFEIEIWIVARIVRQQMVTVHNALWRVLSHSLDAGRTDGIVSQRTGSAVNAAMFLFTSFRFASYCIVLCCAVLYCTVLCCSASYCIVPYYILFHFIWIFYLIQVDVRCPWSQPGAWCLEARHWFLDPNRERFVSVFHHVCHLTQLSGPGGSRWRGQGHRWRVKQVDSILVLLHANLWWWHECVWCSVACLRDDRVPLLMHFVWYFVCMLLVWLFSWSYFMDDNGYGFAVWQWCDGQNLTSEIHHYTAYSIIVSDTLEWISLSPAAEEWSRGVRLCHKLTK